MSPTRSSLLLAGSALALLAALLGLPNAEAAPKTKPHLDFRTSYADALLEARVRNLPVLVTRHKDD